MSQCFLSPARSIISLTSSLLSSVTHTAFCNSLSTNSPPLTATFERSKCFFVSFDVRRARKPSLISSLTVTGSRIDVKRSPSVTIPCPRRYGVAVRPSILSSGLTVMSLSRNLRYIPCLLLFIRCASSMMTRSKCNSLSLPL